MVSPLRPHELRYRGACCRVPGGDHDGPSAGEIFVGICNGIPLLRHHRSAGHVTLVDERGCAEIARGKGMLNEPHVSTDICYAD